MKLQFINYKKYEQLYIVDFYSSDYFIVRFKIHRSKNFYFMHDIDIT